MDWDLIDIFAALGVAAIVTGVVLALFVPGARPLWPLILAVCLIVIIVAAVAHSAGWLPFV